MLATWPRRSPPPRRGGKAIVEVDTGAFENLAARVAELERQQRDAIRAMLLLNGAADQPQEPRPRHLKVVE